MLTPNQPQKPNVDSCNIQVDGLPDTITEYNEKKSNANYSFRIRLTEEINTGRLHQSVIANKLLRMVEKGSNYQKIEKKERKLPPTL